MITWCQARMGEPPLGSAGKADRPKHLAVIHSNKSVYKKSPTLQAVNIFTVKNLLMLQTILSLFQRLQQVTKKRRR